MDPHSLEYRTSLTKMLTSLFDHWGLEVQDRAALLGLPTFEQSGPLENNKDALARAGILLGVHKCLRTIFPQNIDLAYLWVTRPNKQFENNTPLSCMLKSRHGSELIRHYLEQECER